MWRRTDWPQLAHLGVDETRYVWLHATMRILILRKYFELNFEMSYSCILHLPSVYKLTCYNCFSIWKYLCYLKKFQIFQSLLWIMGPIFITLCKILVRSVPLNKKGRKHSISVPYSCTLVSDNPWGAYIVLTILEQFWRPIRDSDEWLCRFKLWILQVVRLQYRQPWFE